MFHEPRASVCVNRSWGRAGLPEREFAEHAGQGREHAAARRRAERGKQGAPLQSPEQPRPVLWKLQVLIVCFQGLNVQSGGSVCVFHQ